MESFRWRGEGRTGEHVFGFDVFASLWVKSELNWEDCGRHGDPDLPASLS